MKKWMVLLLTVLLLTGCGKDQEEAAPKEFKMRDIPITLPQGTWRKTISGTQDHFIHNDQVVGGIALMEIENETMEALRHSFDYSELILTYIQENIIPDFDPERYDGHMMESSTYGYFDLEVITMDGTTMHYLLEGTDAYFDVWFRMDHADARTRAKILESIRSEALTVEGRAEFAENGPTDW